MYSRTALHVSSGIMKLSGGGACLAGSTGGSLCMLASRPRNSGIMERKTLSMTPQHLLSCIRIAWLMKTRSGSMTDEFIKQNLRKEGYCGAEPAPCSASSLSFVTGSEILSVLSEVPHTSIERKAYLSSVGLGSRPA